MAILSALISTVIDSVRNATANSVKSYHEISCKQQMGGKAIKGC